MKLRDYFDDKPGIAIIEFHEKEKDLLNEVLETVQKDKLYFKFEHCLMLAFFSNGDVLLIPLLLLLFI